MSQKSFPVDITVDDFNENTKDTTVKRILNFVCALLNTSGGKLEVFLSPSAGRSCSHTLIRIVEQRFADIIGSRTTSEKISLESFTVDKISFSIGTVTELCTLNYNLFLPSMTQIKSIDPNEPIQFIERILEGRPKFNQHPQTQQPSHRVFLKGECVEPDFRLSRNSTCLSAKESPLIKRKKDNKEKFNGRVSAFANDCGGHIYCGIENGYVDGLLVNGDFEAIEFEVKKSIEKLIWGGPEKPEKGRHWDIFFEPVMDENHDPISQTYVVVVYIAPYQGGVFVLEPECYHIIHGEVERMSFATWKKELLRRKIVRESRSLDEYINSIHRGRSDASDLIGFNHDVQVKLSMSSLENHKDVVTHSALARTTLSDGETKRNTVKWSSGFQGQPAQDLFEVVKIKKFLVLESREERAKRKLDEKDSSNHSHEIENEKQTQAARNEHEWEDLKGIAGTSQAHDDGRYYHRNSTTQTFGHEIYEKLEHLKFNQCDKDAFRCLIRKAKSNYSNIKEVELFALAQEVSLAVLRGFSQKASKLLRRYRELSSSIPNSEQFQLIESYLRSDLHRTMGNFEKSLELAVRGLLEKTGGIPSLIKARLSINAALAITELLGRSKEQRLLERLVEQHHRNALKICDEVRGFRSTTSDLKQAIFINKTLLLLGFSFSGGILDESITHTDLERAKDILTLLNDNILEGNSLNPFRESQRCLVLSALSFRLAQSCEDNTGQLRFHHLSTAVRYSEEACRLSTACRFHEMKLYSRTYHAIMTERLVCNVLKVKRPVYTPEQ